jgi:hypothetical protein
MPAADPVRRRAALIATAAALPVTVLLVLAANHGALSGSQPPGPQPSGSSGPVLLGPVDVPPPRPSGQADRSCPAVISNLPVTLAGQHSRLVHSASLYVAAWGQPPLVLRCGVPRPAGLVATSALTVINGVPWLTAQHAGAVVWTAVGRPVYVELTVPTAYSSAPVVDLSAALTQALPTPRPS